MTDQPESPPVLTESVMNLGSPLVASGSCGRRSCDSRLEPIPWDLIVVWKPMLEQHMELHAWHYKTH